MDESKVRNREIVRPALLAAVAGFVILVAACARHTGTSLKDAYKNAFYIGAALNRSQIDGKDKPSLAIVEKHFNSITPENILKWEKVHPTPGRYDFAPVDSFVAFGEKHKMFIVGHTLVWHNQTPAWVFEDSSGNPASRDTLLQRMREHIFVVAGRYRGRINGWDVVNEAIEDDGQLQQSKWLQIIGEDYVQKAFAWAHEAAPDAELYYNDFNMWHAGKRQRVIRLVRELQAKGVHIDGIGMQGHWGLSYPSRDELEASLQAYAALGVKVMITELDINVLPIPNLQTGAEITENYAPQKELNPYVEGLPDSMTTKLTERYADLFRIFHKYRDMIARVTFWGVHDGISWLNNWPVRGRTAYPLLFDRQYQPKPAFDAVVKVATDD